MPEPFPAPSIPPAAPPAPRKMNPWVIVLCVVVLLCCLCFGGLGLLLAFGEDLLSMFVFQLAPLALLA